MYGYIKQIKSTFGWSNNNPYYIIPQLIQDLCLLFFQTFIDSKILTEDEIDIMLELFRENHRFVLFI